MGKKEWHRLLWTSLIIPKHVIVAWMAVLNRLPIMDRMIAWGLEVDGVCKLCRNGMESRDHLFFDCSFSKEVWGAGLQLCGLNRSILGWNAELEWGIRRLKREVTDLCNAKASMEGFHILYMEREEWKDAWSEDCAAH